MTRRQTPAEPRVAEAAILAIPACEYGMSGWCSQLGRHDKCHFSTLAGKAAVLTGTYGRTDGHQWVCTCPCHEQQGYPPCPHPEHAGQHRRRTAAVRRQVQINLF